jgi:hypothetical protein
MTLRLPAQGIGLVVVALAAVACAFVPAQIGWHLTGRPSLTAEIIGGIATLTLAGISASHAVRFAHGVTSTEERRLNETSERWEPAVAALVVLGAILHSAPVRVTALIAGGVALLAWGLATLGFGDLESGAAGVVGTFAIVGAACAVVVMLVIGVYLTWVYRDVGGSELKDGVEYLLAGAALLIWFKNF